MKVHDLYCDDHTGTQQRRRSRGRFRVDGHEPGGRHTVMHDAMLQNYVFWNDAAVQLKSDASRSITTHRCDLLPLVSHAGSERAIEPGITPRHYGV